jgi:uncharacterized protein YaiE (UPF0345 family)
LFSDGSKKTLGVMLPGEYAFSTGDKEIMAILSGDLDVLLPGESDWKAIKGGSPLRWQRARNSGSRSRSCETTAARSSKDEKTEIGPYCAQRVIPLFAKSSYSQMFDRNPVFVTGAMEPAP